MGERSSAPYGATLPLCPDTGKRCHERKRFAREALNKLRRERGYRGHVYPCPGCGAWHVGSSEWERREG